MTDVPPASSSSTSGSSTSAGPASGRFGAIPPALWIITLSTLAPFPLAAIVYGWGAPDVARPALTVILNWSGCVLAFLGGVRWGLESGRAEPRPLRLVISVLSPVVAWAILFSRHRIPDGWVIGEMVKPFRAYLEDPAKFEPAVESVLADKPSA